MAQTNPLKPWFIRNKLQEERYGYCRCGCGGKTRVPHCNDASKRWTKGIPLPYIHGHSKLRQQRYVVDSLTGCWNWLYDLDDKGYAMLRLWVGGKRRTFKAYRVSYELEYGPIPKGLELDHLCENKACINPEHLEAVTHTVNMRRSVICKLDMDKAREIRLLHANGYTRSDLARRFGVDHKNITDVVRGRIWKESDATN